MLRQLKPSREPSREPTRSNASVTNLLAICGLVTLSAAWLVLHQQQRDAQQQQQQQQQQQNGRLQHVRRPPPRPKWPPTLSPPSPSAPQGITALMKVAQTWITKGSKVCERTLFRLPYLSINACAGPSTHSVRRCVCVCVCVCCARAR